MNYPTPQRFFRHLNAYIGNEYIAVKLTTMNFKQGDVVQLKSGGVKMTVVWIPGGNDSITCIWYSEQSDTYKWEKLPAEILKMAE